MAPKTKSIEDAIIEATGAQPGDTFQIVTPQFTREPGYPPPGVTVPTAADLERLKTAKPPELREMGLRPWGEEPEGQPGARMIWLFPAEWYAHLPDGMEVVNIFGEVEPFRQGESDNDIRFGCLSFGIFEAV